MTEFKGTKGPWSAYDPRPVRFAGMLIPVGPDNGNGTHTSTAYLQDWSDDAPDEAQANARLIAAAPDLLEALIAMRNLKISTDMTYEDAYDSMFKLGGRDAWDVLDAAIAKALGQ